MADFEASPDFQDVPSKSEEVSGKNKMEFKRGASTGAYSMLLMTVIVAIAVSSLIQPLHANPTCILNCAQCVKIYGDFFDGHSCAKVCMESRSRFDSFVDCADPTTIARFLKSNWRQEE